MIKEVIEIFDESRNLIKERLRTLDDDATYETLLKTALGAMNETRENDINKFDYKYYDYEWDLNRFVKIDFGDYQGTLQFIFTNNSYQPSSSEIFWTEVSYGSCSGCDALQSLQSDYVNYDYKNGEEKISDELYDGYFTLVLHMIQKIKRLESEEKEF